MGMDRGLTIFFQRRLSTSHGRNGQGKTFGVEDPGGKHRISNDGEMGKIAGCVSVFV